MIGNGNSNIMLMKYIDALACPVCKATRLWKLDGDFTDERMATGKVICPNKHTWYVQEEVMRLDEENSDEDMQFLNHPLTGFPTEIDEKARGEFLIALRKFVEDFVQKEDTPLVLLGSPILFMKYLPQTERDIIIVNSSEGILRQVQEIAVSKRLYKQVSAIRAENVDLQIPNAQMIYVFDEIPENLGSNEHALLLERDPSANIIWEDNDSILMKK